jgi:hypothetical protein
LYSDEFAARARLDPQAFTHERSLPLPALGSTLLDLRKGTIQDELDQFANLLGDGQQLQGVTASAVCQARRKLEPLAVWALSERAVRDFYRGGSRPGGGTAGGFWGSMVPPQCH